MKKILFAITVCTVILACNDNSKEPVADTKKTSADSLVATNNSKEYFAELVNNYLLLKNALAGDNSTDAANAASRIKSDIDKISGLQLDSSEKRAFDAVKMEIAEHSEHIKDNSSDIGHQREHFDLLSQDMMDLVEVIGADRALFLTYCPMYNNKKGAHWLSETKEIRNPYYGKEMLTCGEVKKEITKK